MHKSPYDCLMLFYSEKEFDAPSGAVISSKISFNPVSFSEDIRVMIEYIHVC